MSDKKVQKNNRLKNTIIELEIDFIGIQETMTKEEEEILNEYLIQKILNQ